MPKINQEEYEVLKGLDDKWKWIARDESGSCFIFELKPIKDNRYELWEWVGNTIIDKIFDSSLFQFIQWEDDEPYNIQELIEEYENEEFGYHIMEAARDYEQFVKESEETEVKSIQDLIDKWENYKNVARTVANPRAIEHADMFISDLNQLDEPEVLSQELPVIPQFVAEYLDFAKSDVPLMRVLELANTRNELPKWEKEYDWISANDEKFARAWLDGYEVAEEQKYVVLNKSTMQMILHKSNDTINPTVTDFEYYTKTKNKCYEFTESEIKDYNKSYWPFAVPVEEMEE